MNLSKVTFQRSQARAIHARTAHLEASSSFGIYTPLSRDHPSWGSHDDCGVFLVFVCVGHLFGRYLCLYDNSAHAQVQVIVEQFRFATERITLCSDENFLFVLPLAATYSEEIVSSV